MWSLRRIVLLSVLYSLINVGLLALWSSPVFGAERPHTNSGGGSTTAASTGNNSGRAVNGLAAAGDASAGIVYAPRDVVDMTRLVLETNRDENSHLAHVIEHATTIIIVFFSVLGAAGTVFGIKKVDDIERRANSLTASFEKSVEAATAKVTGMETDYSKKIADAEKEVEAKVKLTEANLHLEINDHMELVSARLEIEQAATKQQPLEEATRQLANAVKRIERVLDASRVADQAKVRGLADVAYAKKRLQDDKGAFEAVQGALAMAERVGEKDTARLALLNYNAACYACICGKTQEAMSYLTAAIDLEAHWKRKAGADQDFDPVRNEAAFRELMK